MNETNLQVEIKTEPNIRDRFLAGFIDYSIIYIFFIVYVYAFGEPNEEGEFSVSGFLGLPPIVFWGIMTVGLEQWFGATLGNSIVGLKPISIRGFTKKLTFAQSLKRHLLDPIDMFFFGLIAIITIKNTNQNQRLGDIWGNTIVVENTDKKIN